MGFWEFIAKIVDTLAWPALTAYVLHLLVKHRHAVADVIEKIKVKDVEVSFRKKFDDVRQTADDVKGEVVKGGAAKSTVEASSLLLDASKKALAAGRTDIAILDIWKSVEGELTKAIQQEGLVRFVSPLKLVNWAYEKELISRADRELFDKLRQLRNEVVHATDVRPITNAEVYEFAELASVLVARLAEIQGALKDFPLDSIRNRKAQVG